MCSWVDGWTLTGGVGDLAENVGGVTVGREGGLHDGGGGGGLRGESVVRQPHVRAPRPSYPSSFPEKHTNPKPLENYIRYIPPGFLLIP